MPNVRYQQARFTLHTFYVAGYGCGFYAKFFCYAIYDACREIERIMEVLSETVVRITTVAAEEQLAPLFSSEMTSPTRIS